MIIDNAITNHSVGIINDSNVSKTMDKQKKRKDIDEENKDTIISKPKKRKTPDVINIYDKKQKNVQLQ